MNGVINANRTLGRRDPMIYGHFIEHFHRQIYGGVYDPGNPLSDAEGFRQDVLEAMRRIHVPVLRWPGGCFVSSYHWKKAVGRRRTPFFDKAWRVEDPNDFGTDEYVALCRKIGCEPYICTNAGTGTAEEMSDWVEYCNLDHEGEFAKWRMANGHEKPFGVKYWSIGNENYGCLGDRREIGAGMGPPRAGIGEDDEARRPHHRAHGRRPHRPGLEREPAQELRRAAGLDLHPQILGSRGRDERLREL